MVGVVKQVETAALKAASDKKSGPFTRQLVGLYTRATIVDDAVIGMGAQPPPHLPHPPPAPRHTPRRRTIRRVLVFTACVCGAQGLLVTPPPPATVVHGTCWPFSRNPWSARHAAASRPSGLVSSPYPWRPVTSCTTNSRNGSCGMVRPSCAGACLRAWMPCASRLLLPSDCCRPGVAARTPPACGACRPVDPDVLFDRVGDCVVVSVPRAGLRNIDAGACAGHGD